MSNDLKTNLSALLQKDWEKYKQKKKELKKEERRVSYNIISVSSYTGHLENYHSDVWGFLLDASSIHQQGYHFLIHFCNYLRAIGCITKDVAQQFYDGFVLREKGRIDVCIINAEKTACIIIENKINNAVDQENQLERYYSYALQQKMKVEAMLYISARGDRHSSIDGIKVFAIAACNHSEADLLNGWLIPAKKAIVADEGDTKEDIHSFVHQYALLLQHLSVLNLKVMTAKILYELLNKKEDLETASLLEKELVNIKLYRHQVFSESMGANYFEPFKKKTNYTGYINHMIFKEWNYKNTYNFQLDIIHYRDHTKFVFYETKARMSKEQTDVFLTDVLGSKLFSATDNDNNPHHFSFAIEMRDSIDTLEKLDKEVIEKAKWLFEKMQACNAIILA